MARLNEEFLLAWSSLFSNEETPSWQVISLTSIASVEVLAGRRSPENAEAVICSFPSTNLSRGEKLPEGKGFLVERAAVTSCGGVQLALTRQEAGSMELFTSMVCDVIGALDDIAAEGASESTLLQTFIGRVRAWQQFMSRGSGPLSPEAELGLAGELHFMEQLLDAGVSPATVLEGWVGPDEAPQDFLLGDGAVEIKATLSSSGFPVKISSLEQLDDDVISPLFLFAIRFSRGNSGVTLPQIVDGLARRLQHTPCLVTQLYERLILVGYTRTQASQYTRQFEPKERLILAVREGFPRLTSSAVPLGITRTIYEINLDHARNFACSFDEILSHI